MDNKTRRPAALATLNKMIKTPLTHIGFAALLFSLAGCGGTKVLKEPQRLVATNSLAAAADPNLSVTLDWVIYRDGPGTWAKNVDWDEYQIRVRNPGIDPIQITNVKVIDSLGTPVSAGLSRSKLVKGTKQTKKRYKGQGLEVKAGVSAGTLLAAGAVTAAGVAGAGAAVMYGGTAAMAGVATGFCWCRHSPSAECFAA